MALPEDYSTAFDHLSQGEQRACQIALRVSSVLSILGSTYIVFSLLGPKRQSELNKRMYNRLLLGLSISDVLSSLGLFVGAWAMPKDSLHNDSLYGNAGNQGTCDAQGFWLQVFYYSSIFYTAGLSLNFLFYVKYQWSEETLKTRLEPCVHAVSWLVPISLAILCLVFDMYNPTAFFCYVNTYPVGCDHSNSVDCIRGSHLWFWRSIAQVIPFAVCFSIICGSMLTVYWTVRKQELTVRASLCSCQPSHHNEECAARWAQNSKRAFHKAAQYIGSFLFVWVPLLFVALAEDLGFKIHFVIWFLDASILPCVGLLNAFVYAGLWDSCGKCCLPAGEDHMDVEEKAVEGVETRPPRTNSGQRNKTKSKMLGRNILVRWSDALAIFLETSDLGTSEVQHPFETPTAEMTMEGTTTEDLPGERHPSFIQDASGNGTEARLSVDMPPLRPLRVESDARDLSSQAEDSPPLRPLRLESLLEDAISNIDSSLEDKDESDEEDINPGCRFRCELGDSNPDWSPPSRPERMESEIEPCSHSYCAQAGKGELPLSKPWRVESEMEDV